MIKVNEQDRNQTGSAAIAHFFVGLMKADAGLSVAEERKVELLIYKMRHGLPGDYEITKEYLNQIQKDPDYQDWDPDRHGDEGLHYFDLFKQLDQSGEEYSEAILDLMEIVMEVGDVTPGEEKYLNRMREEFQKRKEKKQ